MKKKNLAFTLAEVLIVIGIIGVVAALTLPNLNHATGDKERVTKVKKIYSSLTEAFDRAQVIYGDYNTWFKNPPDVISDMVGPRITEFMKVAKICSRNSSDICFADTDIISKSGSTYTSPVCAGNVYCVILSDGMSVGIDNGASPDVYVDIDGPNKGKNQLGTDIFMFKIDFDNNMIYPFGQSGTNAIDKLSNGDLTSWTFEFGNVAANWIIENDNADYLKADNTGKCNDSDIVLNWTTNTSCH